MPTEFTLPARLAGFAASGAVEGGTVQLVYRELVAPTDAEHLLDRLERMQKGLFGLIPDLPPPPRIDHLLVVIRPDLSATAYVNELALQAQVKPNRAIKAGEAIYVRDIDDISSIDLGVEIPDDAAVILVRSNGWRRSLFFDYGPILDEPIPRDYPLEKVLAQQALLLLGLMKGPSGDQQIRLAEMKAGLQRLERLLEEREENEALYQELLEAHPWMLGGLYDRVLRHENLDDERIPDFTARRAHDLTHDIVEIKHPFLELFRRNGGFSR